MQDAVTEWLPRWHEQLTQFAAEEGQWLAMVLPSQQPAMLLQVCPARQPTSSCT